MTDTTREFDAVVVGAGTAGSAAAWQLAKAGLRVALLDNLPLHDAGPRWVNAVPPWMFERAGVPLPEKPELRTREGAFVMRPGYEHATVALPERVAWEIDMRALNKRLQRYAAQHGVTAIGGVRVESVEFDGPRPTALRPTALRLFDRAHGTTLLLRARLFVDASGSNGVLRRRVPALASDCPDVAREHVCAAAQWVFHIRDTDAARRFLDRNHVNAGDTLSMVGISGGYSVLNVTIEPGLDEVALLSGAIPAAGNMTGTQIIEAFRTRESWLGQPVFGGVGAIPLRRPYDRLVSPGVALIGDAASQVFSAHGSGIGAGMVAAKQLADAIRNAPDPGDEDALWQYATRFQRGLGATLAAYDIFRRFSQRLTPAESVELIAHGFITEYTLETGLLQKMPWPHRIVGRRLARGVVKAPKLAKKLAPDLARMHAALALYQTYPGTRDRAALRRFSRLSAKLVGDAPDLRA